MKKVTAGGGSKLTGVGKAKRRKKQNVVCASASEIPILGEHKTKDGTGRETGERGDSPINDDDD